MAFAKAERPGGPGDGRLDLAVGSKPRLFQRRQRSQAAPQRHAAPSEDLGASRSGSSASDGTRYGMCAALILCLARTRRLAMVGSAMRKARAARVANCDATGDGAFIYLYARSQLSSPTIPAGCRQSNHERLTTLPPVPPLAGMTKAPNRSLSQASYHYRLQRVGFHQVLQVVEIALKLPLGNAHDERLGELEEAAWLRLDGEVDSGVAVNLGQGHRSLDRERS
jgi:hypothetical protein